MAFTELTREKALNKACQHAAHCMLYCKGKAWESHENAVMMQLRYDGSFGFIGGYVDARETLEQALTRELHEEIGFDSIRHPVMLEHYVYSAYDNENNLCLHFYSMELSVEDFKAAERRVFDAEHFGTETLGLVRIPLYIARHGRGLPTFLCNRFVGNARQQLIRGLMLSKVLNEEQINQAVIEAEQSPYLNPR